MEKLCDSNAAPNGKAKLEHPYDSIARKPYHQAIDELEMALDSLETNIGNLAMLPLHLSTDKRSKALRAYLDNAAQKESIQAELQDYVYYCSNKRNTSVIRQLLYLKQRIQTLVGKDELSDLDLSESEQNELLNQLKNIFEEREINPAPKQIPAKAKPWANDEAFPISGSSFNKYFRNPDFTKDPKWLEASKVLKDVRRKMLEGRCES